MANWGQIPIKSRRLLRAVWSKLARFEKLRQNCATLISNCANTIVSPTTDLLNSILASHSGLTLALLLAGHPDMARRTAQRLIAKLVETGQVKALGEGRARRYFVVGAPSGTLTLAVNADIFPSFIPLSADSQDILAYIDQPPEARKPVGYQRDFLDAYRPMRLGICPSRCAANCTRWAERLTLMRQQALTAVQF